MYVSNVLSGFVIFNNIGICFHWTYHISKTESQQFSPKLQKSFYTIAIHVEMDRTGVELDRTGV